MLSHNGGSQMDMDFELSHLEHLITWVAQMMVQTILDNLWKGAALGVNDDGTASTSGHDEWLGHDNDGGSGQGSFGSDQEYNQASGQGSPRSSVGSGRPITPDMKTPEHQVDSVPAPEEGSQAMPTECSPVLHPAPPSTPPPCWQ